ncbi:hypothetical protein KUCAC02_035537 [Chaenocephalus aceratus]|nr:hypothetical protein KUCAC02_035537 [Chaenocephalus aceratus]
MRSCGVSAVRPECVVSFRAIMRTLAKRGALHLLNAPDPWRTEHFSSSMHPFILPHRSLSQTDLSIRQQPIRNQHDGVMQQHYRITSYEYAALLRSFTEATRH